MNVNNNNKSDQAHSYQLQSTGSAFEDTISQYVFIKSDSEDLSHVPLATFKHALFNNAEILVSYFMLQDFANHIKLASNIPAYVKENYKLDEKIFSEVKKTSNNLLNYFVNQMVLEPGAFKYNNIQIYICPTSEWEKLIYALNYSLSKPVLGSGLIDVYTTAFITKNNMTPELMKIITGLKKV